MKKALLLVVLLIVVIAVTARLPRKPVKHGPKKPNGCQLQNCKKCRSKPFSCDECDRGFVREKVPLGYACRKTCSPGLYSIQGTCVEKQDCPLNCKTCPNRLYCYVCESGHVLYQRVGRCFKECLSGFKPKVNPMGGKKCVETCNANCKLCQGKSCSVCEHGYALYKGYHQRGKGFCVTKCPFGSKAKVNPAGGNQCVRECTANCKTCQGSFCSVCERGHALYKGFGGSTKGRCLRRCPKGYKIGVNPSGGNKCVRYTCGKGCVKCINGSCSECKDGFELNQEKNMCKKKKDNCARGCRICSSGICSECKQGFTLNRKSKRCVKLCSPTDPDVKTRPGCEGKLKGKEGKKKRKGGKRKPNRKPTTKPSTTIVTEHNTGTAT